VNLALHNYLLRRFWLTFFKVGLVVILIWSFALGVRFFIRQELFDIRLFLLTALMTLPAVVPYLACVSAQLTVIQLHERGELLLTTLMGHGHGRRFLHFGGAILVLSMFMLVYENQIKPQVKQSLRQAFFNLEDSAPLKNLPLGKTLALGPWILAQPQKDLQVYLHSNGASQTTIVTRGEGPSAKGAQLMLSEGTLWPAREATTQSVQFEQLLLPLAGPTQAGEISFKGLWALLHSPTVSDNKQGHIILRNGLAVGALFFLGLSLGYFTLVTSKAWGYGLCLALILGAYFPLTTFARRFECQGQLWELGVLYGPLIFAIMGGLVLNRFASRRGIS
jgi:lipopolysaccharide export LptBFGC system permease protein LptF